jgi:2',3'-cyclic-nucleotide 2'-phosphodiesterase / 3'-nucleotidase / 5'-nucleotidase
MGYDAVGIGDDDLSLGKKFLLEVSKKAKFPFLSSNLMDEESGTLLFQPYFLKEVNGLKIGVFSVISPESFLGPSDPRMKGLVFRDPIETAQNMVRELGPQTDLIVLLSHLGHPKDVQLAQTLRGIDVIAGSHSGDHLVFPSVVKNTVVVQTSFKGMFGGRIDLTLLKKNGSFYNRATQYSLERELKGLRDQLTSIKGPDSEKADLRKAMEPIEQRLRQLQGENFFAHVLTPLDEQFEDHPDIEKMIEAFKKRFP